ncbi:MAG: DUF2804 domain-containing protein [Eubacteriales bacterium]|nr:DUF2804 domain-containing protein [Eubacteriales bacterium]
MQRFMEEGALLNERGELADRGFATSLCRRYDRAAIKAGRMRIKEWDYYCVTSGSLALALTIADNSYMGLDSVTLLDLDTGRQQTKSYMRLFPMGRTGLPATSERGDVGVEKRGYRIRFENDGEKRVLSAHLDDFEKGKPLDARVVLTDPPRDSMVIATPFPGKPRHFYYNQKINCLRARGEVRFDGQTHRFAPETASAVLDWGRGVWTYRNTWYWCSVSGYAGGERFGMNLGYGFGDTSAATENVLFYKGEAHKLGHVTFHIPQLGGSDDFLRPWRMDDDAGRLRLVFTPALDRASLTSALVIKSDQHQVFGRFSGTVRLDDGTELELENLVGFAEKVTNLW